MFCFSLFGLEGTRHWAVVCHIYSTPENGTLAFTCFSLSFRSGQKMAKKSPVFSEVIQGAGCFTSIYYFLVVSWRKGCSLSVLDVDAGWCSGPQFCLKHYVKNVITTSTVLGNSGLSTWTDCSRNKSSFFYEEEKIWRWLLAKNSKVMSRFFLQEADWANFYTEFLIGSTNVHRSDINDWQTRCFRCLIVNDCLAPCASVWLWNK